MLGVREIVMAICARCGYSDGAHSFFDECPVYKGKNITRSWSKTSSWMSEDCSRLVRSLRVLLGADKSDRLKIKIITGLLSKRMYKL